MCLGLIKRATSQSLGTLETIYTNLRVMAVTLYPLLQNSIKKKSNKWKNICIFFNNKYIYKYFSSHISLHFLWKKKFSKFTISSSQQCLCTILCKNKRDSSNNNGKTKCAKQYAILVGSTSAILVSSPHQNIYKILKNYEIHKLAILQIKSKYTTLWWALQR